MTPKTPHVPYPHSEIAARFRAWADLPTHNDKAILARQTAWHHYCDARDGLPEGTSSSRSRFNPAGLSDDQLGFFQ